SDDPETESLQQRISELEQDNRASLEEINRLRSELLLKDQRINELEEKTRDEQGTTEEKPAAVRPVKTMTGYELSYSQALDLFKRRKYRESIGGFSSLLANDKNNSYSDNCQYWIGECYFALRNYHEAVVAFEKVFTFLNSNKDDDAQIKLGICYFRLNDKERAKLEFEKLIRNYPKSEYVGRATNYLNLISR
ncbi:MAG: tetratricopeptide repeat protein, partial [bacterium]|nr:tetratricopeptide repeat protein [bacterium]